MTQFGFRTVRALLRWDKLSDILALEKGPDGKTLMRANPTERNKDVLDMIDQTNEEM